MTTDVDRRVVRLAERVLVLLAVSVALELLAQLLPPHYSPIAATESALAVGPFGAIERVSLCLRGALVFGLLSAATLALPATTVTRTGNWLLGLTAAAKFVIAFVPTDLAPRPETAHGIIHAVVAFASFFAASIGEVLVARKLLRVAWMPAQLLLRVAQVTVAWSVVLALTAGMGLTFWGVLERIETALLLGWIALFAAALHAHALGMVWRWR